MNEHLRPEFAKLLIRHALAAPLELEAERRWVLYRLEPNPKNPAKPKKRPYQTNGRSASSTEPRTWTTHDAALGAYLGSNGSFSGIGFVLGDGWLGVDLDACMNANGQPHAWAQEILDRFARYTEVSPSQRGVHIICRGELPPGAKHRTAGPVEGSHIEVYDSGRYFTWSGNQTLTFAPYDRLDANDSAVAWLIEKYLTVAPEESDDAPEPPPTVSLTDEEVIDRVVASKYGRSFHAFMEGDYHDERLTRSEADFALACHLADATRDAAQIERVMRSSELVRDKWDERRRDVTYIERTIERALQRTRSTTAALGPDEPDEPLWMTLADLAADPSMLDAPTPLSRWLAWRRNVTLLWGREKDAGKSTLATSDAVAALDAGLTVFWLSADEDPGHVLRRFAALKAPLDRVGILSPQAHAARVTWPAVETLIAERRPDVVYVDALSSVLMRIDGEVPEHSAGERWHGLVARFAEWARAYDAAVVIIHHETKASGEARGSTGIRAGVDMGIRLARPSNVTDNSNLRELTCVGRWPVANPVRLEFDAATGYRTVVDGESFRKLVEAETSMRMRVAAWIHENPGGSKNAVAKGVGGRKGDVYAAIATLEAKPLEQPRHPLRRDRSSDFNGHALPRAVVHHVQRPESPPIRQRVGHEIERPPLVGTVRDGQRFSRCRRDALAALPPHRQALLPVDPVHPLAVHPVTFSPQEDVNPPVAVAGPLLGPVVNPGPKLVLSLTTRDVREGRPADPSQSTRSPTTQPEGLDEEAHQASPAPGLHHFFPKAAFSAWRSRLWSATSCFRHRFSSSSCRSLLASLTSMPLYFDFQR
ncbi:MAG: AAA family ATPase [Acidobacteria bacterium]|nr:AAA family ATPase [Acidobacteriota bacterium]